MIFLLFSLKVISNSAKYEFVCASVCVCVCVFVCVCVCMFGYMCIIIGYICQQKFVIACSTISRRLMNEWT